jgi:chaperonin GroEL (HSP60 family)
VIFAQVSKALREHALTHASKAQLFIKAFAKALEVIPRQLCNNAGFDATDVLSKLRQKHGQPDGTGRVSTDSVFILLCHCSFDIYLSFNISFNICLSHRTSE